MQPYGGPTVCWQICFFFLRISPDLGKLLTISKNDILFYHYLGEGRGGGVQKENIWNGVKWGSPPPLPALSPSTHKKLFCDQVKACTELPGKDIFDNNFITHGHFIINIRMLNILSVVIVIAIILTLTWWYGCNDLQLQIFNKKVFRGSGSILLLQTNREWINKI